MGDTDHSSEVEQPRAARFAGYESAAAWLMSHADFERGSGPRRSKPDFALDRIRSLLRRLDEPQHGRRTVHVAGSKGKGSTAAMIESVLREAGYRTGLFTSPHLHSFAERIRILGAPLPDQEFARLCSELQPVVAAELADDPGHVSTFEILTALAFHAFRQHQVDVQVVEVGLGGRLDSTNVFGEKDAAVITSLSYEHTDILGKKITQIAGEKAGILTAGTHAAVLAPQRRPRAAAVVREVADDLPIPLVDVAERYRWTSAGVEPWGQWFRVERSQPRPTESPHSLYLLPLLGEHQLDNAITAIATIDQLAASGLELSSEALHRGLATVDWPGRLEELPLPESWTPPAGVEREPLPRIVIDGAHNAESVERALDACDQYFPHQRLLVIFGALGDKALDTMSAAIRPRAAGVFATRSDHPRARSAEQVAAAFAGWEGSVYVAPEPADALAGALELAQPGDLILALGSLSLAADLRAPNQELDPNLPIIEPAQDPTQ